MFYLNMIRLYFQEFLSDNLRQISTAVFITFAFPQEYHHHCTDQEHAVEADSPVYQGNRRDRVSGVYTGEELHKCIFADSRRSREGQ